MFYVPLQMVIPALIIAQIIFVGFCGTVLFHRTVAHKNKVNPYIEKGLLLLSWVGATSSAVAWAGAHRKHHRYSDTDKDPHSPILLGKFNAYWQLSNNNKDLIKYVPDLLRNPWYVFQHKHYFKVLLGLHLSSIILLPYNYYYCLLIIPGFLMWFSGSMINIFCHNKKGPTNNLLLGLFVGGEGWHKNHHEDPANPSFRHVFDWGGKIHSLIK